MSLGMTRMAEVEVEKMGLSKFECKELSLTEPVMTLARDHHDWRPPF